MGKMVIKLLRTSDDDNTSNHVSSLSRSFSKLFLLVAVLLGLTFLADRLELQLTTFEGTIEKKQYPTMFGNTNTYKNNTAQRQHYANTATHSISAKNASTNTTIENDSINQFANESSNESSNNAANNSVDESRSDTNKSTHNSTNDSTSDSTHKSQKESTSDSTSASTDKSQNDSHNDGSTSNPFANNSSSVVSTSTGMVVGTGPPVLTFLVQLSGEFGNEMFKIFRGWGIAKLAEREFGLSTKLVFAQQTKRRGGIMQKGVGTAKRLRRCWTSPSDFKSATIFELGNKLLKKKYFKDIESKLPKNFTLSDGLSTLNDLKQHLGDLSEFIKNNPDWVKEQNATNEYPDVPRMMVQVSSLTVYPIIDEFYDDLRQTFVFDDKHCCGSTLENPPLPDESILHLRNYATEFKKERQVSLGFEEIPSDRLVNEVLGHLKAGDRLALLGRNLEKESKKEGTQAQNIIEAIRSKNFTVRFAPSTDDPMADLCFLTHSKKELIGNPKSTYFELAAYLGKDDMQLVRSYQYITPELLERGASYQTFQKVVGKDWNHPLLRKRIRFLEYYKIEEETNEIAETLARNHTDIDTNQTKYQIRRQT